MHIANPIYDVVFKYLMEDSKIAKLVISSIIGEDIKELKILPQEFASDIKFADDEKKHKSYQSLTIYRLDFSAKIKTDEGEKQVIIELQKAKFPTDIMRFRRYLGQQFANKDNTGIININGKSRKVGLPIISIYFLGHKLDNIKSGAIKISRQYFDLLTGDVINQKESFIESLTLDSYIIQIPYLTDKRRNDLEILLSVFDQTNAIDFNSHILNVSEDDFPEKYRPIIRKLQSAVLDNSVKKRMELEDGIIDELADNKREIQLLEEDNRKIKLEAENAKLDAEIARRQAEQFIQKAEQERIEKEKLQIERENEKIEIEKLQIERENEKIEIEKLQIERENEKIEIEKLQIERENEKIEIEKLSNELSELKKLLNK